MEDEFGRKSSFTGGFYRVVVKGLNILAWITLCVLAIGIVIAYVTDHKLSIIHNENPPAISAAAPVSAPVAAEKSGG